jgi:hypothetical protein
MPNVNVATMGQQESPQVIHAWNMCLLYSYYCCWKGPHAQTDNSFLLHIQPTYIEIRWKITKF